MDTHRVLNALVGALRDRSDGSERELARLTAKREQLDAEQEKVRAQIAEKERQKVALTHDAMERFIAATHMRKRHEPPMCPFCFVFHDMEAPLVALNELDGAEPLRCTDCGETYLVPV